MPASALSVIRLLYRSHRAILEGRVVVFCWVVTVSGGWDPAVDPVLCSPYQEPDRFWSLDESGLLRAGVPWLESRRAPVVVGSAPADQKLGVQQAVLELGFGDGMNWLGWPLSVIVVADGLMPGLVAQWATSPGRDTGGAMSLVQQVEYDIVTTDTLTTTQANRSSDLRP